MACPPQSAFRADFARYASHFAGESVELVHHGVDGLFQKEDLAADIYRNLLRQVSGRDRGRNFCNVPDLACKVASHRVDRVGEVLPGTGDARHLRLASEPAVSSHFTGHASHFGSEGAQLVDHRVDGVFEF